MKNTKFIPLLVLPFLVASCSGGGKLEIPVVDVENLQINLPEKPTFNQGAIKTDGTYDYIDLYELSDFHGAVNYEVGSSEVKLGLGRLSSYFLERRAENPGGVVLLSGGDMWQGSADSNLTRGYVVTQSMNYMGFDSMTLGNHEFDWTDEWIKKNGQIADFPLLCANLTDKTTNKRADFVQASTVVTRGDYKIGIIGTIGPVEYSIMKSAIENYKFEAENAVVSAEAARLREEEHCDVVVWSSHNSVGAMPTVTGVDAAFGGHEHAAKYEVRTGVVYSATQDYGVDIAHVQLKINKESKAVETNLDDSGLQNALDFGAALAEEEKVSSIRSQYAAATDEIKHIKIGSTNAKLALDGELANLCVRAMQEEAQTFSNEQNLGYDIKAAFHNKKGGVRSDIDAGEINYGHVYTAFPFDNEIVIIEIDGTKAKNLFKDNKVLALAIYHTYQKLDEFVAGEKYYYCTTDYLATSSKVFNLKDTDFIRTGMFVRDVVAQKIKNLGNVNANDFSKDNSEYKPVV